ncbi:hypothetical protein JYK21_00710 [Ralstonia pickettii]|nr:hypothetical protein [Ralstonia pickettii]
MAKTEQNEKRKMNPVLWILFAIIIPLIIVIVIISIILGIAGFNVIDWAKEKGNEIPVVSNFISSDEELDKAQEIERMTTALKSRDDEIEQLNIQISDLEANIADLEQEILRQEQIIDSSEEVSAEQEPTEPSDRIKQIAKTYQEMKSAKAAEILELMEQDEVIIILQEIPNDVRGEILQAMDAESAAAITRLLMNEE